MPCLEQIIWEARQRPRSTSERSYSTVDADGCIITRGFVVPPSRPSSVSSNSSRASASSSVAVPIANAPPGFRRPTESLVSSVELQPVRVELKAYRDLFHIVLHRSKPREPCWDGTRSDFEDYDSWRDDEETLSSAVNSRPARSRSQVPQATATMQSTGRASRRFSVAEPDVAAGLPKRLASPASQALAAGVREAAHKLPSTTCPAPSVRWSNSGTLVDSATHPLAPKKTTYYPSGKRKSIRDAKFQDRPTEDESAILSDSEDEDDSDSDSRVEAGDQGLDHALCLIDAEQSPPSPEMVDEMRPHTRSRNAPNMPRGLQQRTSALTLLLKSSEATVADSHGSVDIQSTPDIPQAVPQCEPLMLRLNGVMPNVLVASRFHRLHTGGSIT